MTKHELELENLKLRIQLATWSSTFQKYQSYKANGMKNITLDQVVYNYNKCSKMNINKP